MSLYLIVGQPRHGKTQFAVKIAYDYHQKNLEIQKRIDSGKFNSETDIVRQIYSDIDGHFEKCDFVLKAPEDWRDVPENSIIFMDEIHKRPAYCNNDGKMSQNPMIVDLTEHGHFNKDIVLITQDPERLNKGIYKLIEKMYLVKRPIQKPNFATVYEFARFLRDPWQAAASTRTVSYQDSYQFFYHKKWQDMYTSASAHTSMQFKIQKKFIYAFIAIAVLSYSSWFLFTKSGGDKLARNAISGMSGQHLKTENSAVPVNSKQNSVVPDLDLECRKAINVEKPECVKWFDDLTKSKGSVSDSTNKIQVSYNPDNPYDLSDIQDQIKYEVTAKPVFSGCLKTEKGYQAYSQQGTKLNVSQADCKKLFEVGRPFNYFQKEQQFNRTTLTSTEAKNEASTQSKSSNIELQAKLEQAKQQGLI